MLGGVAPTLARLALRRDDQAIVRDSHLDGLTQPALLNDRFRYADAAGISDSNQLGSHFQSTSVITL